MVWGNVYLGSVRAACHGTVVSSPLAPLCISCVIISSTFTVSTRLLIRHDRTYLVVAVEAKRQPNRCGMDVTLSYTYKHNPTRHRKCDRTNAMDGSSDSAWFGFVFRSPQRMIRDETRRAKRQPVIPNNSSRCRGIQQQHAAYLTVSPRSSRRRRFSAPSLFVCQSLSLGQH